MIKVLFICHGNICRSTMPRVFYAQGKNARPFRSVFDRQFCNKYRRDWESASQGNSEQAERSGNTTGSAQSEADYVADYEKADYIIGMDSANMRNLNRMLKNDPEEKLYKFLTFAGSGRDIADPWYTGNFDETYEDIQEGCEGFLDYLEKHGEIHY